MERIKGTWENLHDSPSLNINEMLSCELLEDGELQLHIEDVRTEGLSEKLRWLRDGFKALAELLQKDGRFRDVVRITGVSWIVKKNPKLLERLGFAVSDNGEGFEKNKRLYDIRKKHRPEEFNHIEPGYASITKEHFVELYGN